MFAQLFTVVALAVVAQSVSAADCTRSYTIQEGDYCDKISQAQNVSTYQLAVVNTGSVDTSCSNLQPGASLCLATKPEEDCRTTYTVLLGDTCESVAATNALNTTILSLNNPQIDSECSNIYVGEVLCTSKTVQVAAIPAGGVTVAAPGASTTVLTPSATPAATTTASNPAITSTAAAAAATADDGTCDDDDSTPAAGDDDDCDDDDTPSTSATGAKAGTTTDDGDDDDLPFCDEL